MKSDGSERWYNQLMFHSIGAYKSGFIQKNKGVWHLTPEGEQAMKLSVKEFSDALHKGYNEWLEKKKKAESIPQDIEEEDVVVETEIDYEQASNQAEEGFRSFIAALNPYEFQDLVAALFRGMGYYAPFVAPKGKDGGVDIIAYRDALGLEFPRVKVQVKHYPSNPVSADVVRQLRGTLSHEVNREWWSLRVVSRTMPNMKQEILTKPLPLLIFRYLFPFGLSIIANYLMRIKSVCPLHPFIL